MPFLESCARVLAFAVLLGGPAWAAWRAARTRLLPGAAASVQATAAGVLWLGWLVLWVRALGGLHALRLLPMLVPAALASLWAFAGWWREARALRSPHDRGAGTPLPRAVRVVLLPVAAATTVLLFRALVMPPSTWDAISYHMTFAAHWVHHGALLPFHAADGFDNYSHLPHAGEMVLAAFLLPFSTDTAIAGVNFAFTLLIAVALLAIGRELGLDRTLRWLLAGSVCVSPMVLGYLSSAYVDNQVTAMALAGTLFVLRALGPAGGVRDALLACAAFGLAVATKPTPLPFVAIAVLVLFGAEVARPWRTPPPQGRPRAAVLVLGPLLLLGLGAPKYVANARATGNPFYPLAVTLPLVGELPGSAFMARVLAEKGPGTAAQDLENLQVLLSYGGGDEQRRPAGPRFALFAVLAVAFVVVRLCRRPDRWRGATIALLALLPLVHFYLHSTPATVMVRRTSFSDTPRFLAPSLALLAAAALLALPRRGALRAFVIGVVTLSVLADLWCPRYALDHVPAERWLLAGFVALLALGVWLWRSTRARPARRAAAFALLLLPACGAFTSVLQRHRDATRYDYWSAVSIHRLQLAWQLVDDPARPRTVALATGWGSDGIAWFWYPLFGRRLQNEVVYVGVQRRGSQPTHLDSGLVREHGDPEVWFANLQQLGVDRLVLHLPQPMELAWVLAHRDRFALVDAEQYWAVWEVLPVQ